MKIKKGDNVKILQGKDKGRTGKILRVLTKKNMVIVEGINQVKRHIKRQSQEQPGGIVAIEKPLHWSKVAKTTIDEQSKKSAPKAKKTVKKSK